MWDEITYPFPNFIMDIYIFIQSMLVKGSPGIGHLWCQITVANIHVHVQMPNTNPWRCNNNIWRCKTCSSLAHVIACRLSYLNMTICQLNPGEQISNEYVSKCKPFNQDIRVLCLVIFVYEIKVHWVQLIGNNLIHIKLCGRYYSHMETNTIKSLI